MNNANIGALVLAAGKGTRMNSLKPKVLQEVLGTPILSYVYDALEPLFGDKIWTVVGHQADLLAEIFPERKDRFVLQEEQLGTGHALQMAWPHLRKARLNCVLVVSGDIPLITAEMMETFFTAMARTNAPFGFITLTLPSSGNFGMVLRERNEVVGIVEARDYSPSIHGEDSGEVNTGIYMINMDKLEPLLPHLSNNNNSGEYYITDLVSLAVKAGLEVIGAQTGDASLLGVNTMAELVRAEDRLRRSIIRQWTEAGAAIHYADLTVIGPKVSIDPGANIYGPCTLLGETVIETGALVESYCHIKDSVIGERALVRAFSHLDGARLGRGVVAGPYARLRPGAVLEAEAKVGNFVEVKKSVLGSGAKVNHLSYIGDAEIGEGANIGAGTITCNYDGKNKFKTKIGARAFVGSNTALIAPVNVGEGALVAAGSVITKDVPDGGLAFGRARQEIKKKK